MAELTEWVAWLVGPAAIGGGLLLLAATVKVYLQTSLPLVGNIVSSALALTGALLVGYSQGTTRANERCHTTQLERVAMQMRQAMEITTNLQSQAAVQAQIAQEAATKQRGHVDDLVARLQASPMPADCAWRPDELKRLRGIRVHPPDPAGAR
jgi:small-conductance mechanosensitive channel